MANAQVKARIKQRLASKADGQGISSGTRQKVSQGLNEVGQAFFDLENQIDSIAKVDSAAANELRTLHERAESAFSDMRRGFKKTLSQE